MPDNVLFFLKFKRDTAFFYGSLSLLQALPMMQEHGFTAVPVIGADGTYLGSISEGDFLWFVLRHGNNEKLLEETQISDLLRPEFMPAVNINVSFDSLLETSLHQNYVPVVDDRNIFIGIVTRQSLLKFLSAGSRPIMIDPRVLAGLKKRSSADSI